VPWLDVEDEQRLDPACGVQVAVDDRRGLLGSVEPVRPGIVGCHRGDQLHRRQHRPRLSPVRRRLAQQLARRVGRRPDAQLAELRVLRRAIEGHDAVVREDPPPAARQVHDQRPLRRTLRGGRAIRGRAAAAHGDHDEHHRAAGDPEGRQPPPAIDRRGLAHQWAST
jgi:hypothetical protein